jgi:hypothetical protein
LFLTKAKAKDKSTIQCTKYEANLLLIKATREDKKDREDRKSMCEEAGPQPEVA